MKKVVLFFIALVLLVLFTEARGENFNYFTTALCKNFKSQKHPYGVEVQVNIFTKIIIGVICNGNVNNLGGHLGTVTIFNGLPIKNIEDLIVPIAQNGASGTKKNKNN